MRDAAWTIPTPGSRLEESAQTLVQRTREFSSEPTIVVAHSAGGLIAREAERQSPDLVAGIVTVGTPHEGALIAERGPAALAAFTTFIMAEAFAIDPCGHGAAFARTSRTCQVLEWATIGVGDALLLAGIVGDHALQRDDLKPRSTFIQRLNATPERYLRVGITHRVPRRWSVARLVGEFTDPHPSWNDAAADSAVMSASRVYRGALSSMILAQLNLWLMEAMSQQSMLLALDLQCGPFYTYAPDCLRRPFWTPTQYGPFARWYEHNLMVRNASVGLVAALNAADYAWNVAASDMRPSDSFIAASSQRYPMSTGSPFQPEQRETDRRPENGPLPGHNGEPRSDMTRVELERVLRQTFLVPRNPGMMP
jgi:pimeloyl-ACP methyl ester carboxylesterase